jgi:biotin carboxyl carrier protein
MRFDIDAAGRARAVTVERLADSSRFRVVVDGVAREVEARSTDLGLSLVFGSDGEADGRSLDVAATPGSGGEWLVQLPHVDVPVIVDGARHARGRQGNAARPGEQRVTAPMPGRVLRVLVARGDEVSHRQGLVVIEAMKMENELTAPKAGTVTEVAVTEGTSVEAGRLLVVIS